MVDRIREILRARQLSPTQFADMIGVARPIVSHILSGRNKPSLEVVQRIVEAFPDLSLAWILRGSGSMDDQAAPAPVAASAAASAPRRAGPKAPETVPVTPPEAQPGVAAALPAMEAVERSIGANRPVVKAGTAAEAPTLAFSEPAPAVAQVGAAASVVAAEPAEPAPVAPVDVPAPRPAPPEILVVPAAIPATPVAHVAPAAPVGRAEVPPIAQALAEPGKAIRRIVIFYQDGTFTDYQPEAR